MSYFDQSFLSFFSTLRENNNRDWFNDNRATYEKKVKKPFKELVGDLIIFAHEHQPEITIEPKDAIFRINRDVRFSKDKTPYQTHVSAFIGKGGKKSNLPGFYFMLSDVAFHVGLGIYAPAKEELHKIRMEIMHSGHEFHRLIDEKTFVSTFGKLKGDRNKILPAAFKEAAQNEPYLYNKQYFFMTELPLSFIVSDELLAKLKELYLLSMPVNEFLRVAIED
jgi:uncharacterized protein (TIGR02453 family)